MSAVLRLALLSDRYPPEPGGLACAAQRLAWGLAARGAQVEVHALGPELAPGATLETVESDQLTVLRLGSFRRADDTGAALCEQVVRRHARAPYDLIQGQYLVRSGFVAAFAAGQIGIPSVVSARGNDLDRAVFDPAIAAHVLRALDLADAVVGVSCELGRKAFALAARGLVRVIPNGVDAELFRPVARDLGLKRTLGLADREVIGFSGEARVKKGLVPLLKAVAALQTSRPVSLLLAGGVRADDAGLLKVFRRRHPEVQVVELPNRPAAELAPIYALMDVFAHPSLRDGLPNALLEAMACGRPVVAAQVGGIPDVVRDGVDGLLVPPGDAVALAAALEQVLTDASRAAQLGRAARARVTTAFRPEAELEGYERLYRELLVARRRAPGGVFAHAAR